MRLNAAAYVSSLMIAATLDPGGLAGQQYPVSVIPHPLSITRQSGAFRIGAATTIAVPDTSDAEQVVLGGMVRTAVADAGGNPGSLVQGGTDNNVIALVLTDLLSLPSEGYRLLVDPSGVTIAAPTGAGLFYGVQTFRQLLVPADRVAESAVTGDAETQGPAVPSVRIDDAPRFGYRGMHLDVGRHTFPVDFIKRYIDLIALYKMNTFHWHLTEDQGWRIEIRKYPKLTETGGYRDETMVEKNFDPYVGDGVRYGGFYTQDEIRDVVAYAAERYVTIIPEIELPGHSTAAIAAYPELGCTGEPISVATTWGVHEDIYCPSEETFGFLEDVLTEVIALFPGEYIHIGGDEAPKTQWESSPVAQQVIAREGLADEHELQSYFIRRIERFLNANGRRLIGWDEILEGGLAPEATVMSWRGTEGGIAAARMGHDVIMTPYSHVYFDYYQGEESTEPLAIGGFTPLSKVYEFEPVPPELTPTERRYILGAQGNVWTEYMKTPEHVEYMVFPRMLALAEVVWSDAAHRDWEGFLDRLQTNLLMLNRMQVNYRPLDER